VRPKSSRVAAAAAVIALSAFPVACGPKNPDYQSIWSTKPTTTSPKPTEAPEPFAQYLKDMGVSGTPVAPDQLTDLTATIPTPPGWAKSDNPKASPTTFAIAKGEGLPAAILEVFKMEGDFDAAELVKHGNADAALLTDFKQLGASNANFHGFPSSMIEGSYDIGGVRLHTYNRMVVATGSGPDKQRYLIQLSVTSRADKAAPEAADVETIIKGFTVAPK
jgi:hypothetical protein